MSPTLTTFLFEAANFLLLALLLGWLFFNPIRKALADYQARLDALADQANQKLAEAEKSRSEVLTQRQALRDELEKLRSETLEAARQEAQKLIAQAREHARSIKEAADQHVARLDEVQTTAIAQGAAAAAGAAVGRLLEQIGGPGLEAALVQAACRQLKELSIDATPVVIESSAPLSQNSRAQIDAALGKSAANVTHRVVAELGGGVRITTSRGLIDASIAGLGDFARSALLAELMRQSPDGGGNGR